MTLNEEREKILNMVASGKITASEATNLLDALEGEPGSSDQKGKPKYLRILVDGYEKNARTGEESPQKVNIRIPLQLLYAGVKLAGLIPVAAQGPINEALREHGIHLDVSQLKISDLEDLVTHLSDIQVDVDQKEQKVRIFCE